MAMRLWIHCFYALKRAAISFFILDEFWALVGREYPPPTKIIVTIAEAAYLNIFRPMFHLIQESCRRGSFWEATFITVERFTEIY
jgi:predicted branched-subunit amino acid permease